MSSPARAPILLIEDEPDMRDLVARLLDDDASPLLVARSAREGLARLQATPNNMVVVTSGVLRDMSAADMLEAVVRDGGLARRHAFVVVTPEKRLIQTVSAWQSRVPLFTLLEPYGRDELLAVVARAAQCAGLSRALTAGPLATRSVAGGARAAPAGNCTRGETTGRGSATEMSATPPMIQAVASGGTARGILVVGGEQGIRQLVSHTLTNAHLNVVHTPDHPVALTWLRACQEPMVVVLNGTRADQHFDLLLAVVDEASLVRHTYLLMLPNCCWLTPWQRDLLGLLDVPVVSKPFSPVAFRQGILALASPLPSTAPSR